MTINSQNPFDDGFGPNLLDRGGGKFLGGGRSGNTGSSGSFIDPSYEDALHTLGRAFKIPSPMEQRSLIMDDAEAADLARRLTTLREAAGAGFGSPIFSAGPASEKPSIGQQVQEFIAALQEKPPDVSRLEVLRQMIAAADDQIRLALESVCEHEGVQPILPGK